MRSAAVRRLFAEVRGCPPAQSLTVPELEPPLVPALAQAVYSQQWQEPLRWVAAVLPQPAEQAQALAPESVLLPRPAGVPTSSRSRPLPLLAVAPPGSGRSPPPLSRTDRVD